MTAGVDPVAFFEATAGIPLEEWQKGVLYRFYGVEHPHLIARVADALQARDKEHSGHEEPRDFYEDMAAVAVRAFRGYCG